MSTSRLTVAFPEISKPKPGTATVFRMRGAEPDYKGSSSVDVVCGRCRNLIFEGDDGRIQFINVFLQCGYCGAFLRPSPVFALIEALRRVQENPAAIAHLPKLTEVVLKAQKEDQAPGHLLATLQRELPDFAWLVKLATPTNPGEFWALIGALIAFLVYLQGAFKKDPKPSPTIVVNNYLNVPPKAKPGRNDMCQCGSGRKFKKCHGKKA